MEPYKERKKFHLVALAASLDDSSSHKILQSARFSSSESTLTAASETTLS
jgi:hypothetical protein